MFQGSARRRSRRSLTRSLSPQTAVFRSSVSRSTRSHFANRRLRLHIEQTPLAVIEWNTAFEVAAWNPAAERIFGYAAHEAIGRNGRDLLVPPQSRDQVDTVWAALLAQTAVGERSTNENVDKNGASLWCEWYNTPLMDGRGRVVGVASLVQDITAQVEAERARQTALQTLTQSEERFRLLTENTSDMMGIVDAEGTVRFVGEAVQRALGYAPEELLLSQPGDRIHPDDLARRDGVLGFANLPPGAVSEPVIYRFRHKNGTWRWLESVGTNLVDHPSIGGLLINSRDVTDRVEAHELLRWQAHHDALTGLPNRRWFVEQVSERLEDRARKARGAALLFIDLNRFKWVNDSFGHDVGDTFLQEVTRRLQKAVPRHAVLARLGGDEFALLFTHVRRDDEVAWLARTVLHTLSTQPIAAAGQEIRIGASIGIAVFPRDGTTTETLVKAADTAMYQAKERTAQEHAKQLHAAPFVKSQNELNAPPAAAMLDTSESLAFSAGTYQFFQPEMRAAASRQQAFDHALRRAVHSGGAFGFVFQPIVDAARNWQGMEALLRWNHPEQGAIGPQSFLETVRENGLMEPLNRWALREACRAAAQWRAMKVNLPVWVNIAVAQSLDTAAAVLVVQIEEALAEFAGPPDALVLEVTPAMVADTRAVGTLHALKNCGVKLVLDDFGNNDTSLVALRPLPLDALKIDMALVRNVADSPEEAALVRAVVQMGHALHFQVVAEGVETMTQEALLREMGCDLMQGYGISRPLSAQDVYRAPAFSTPATVARVRETSSNGSRSDKYATGYNKENEFVTVPTQ